LENKSVEVPFQKISDEISSLVDEIRTLKVLIAKTNANIKVDALGKKMSIQELIILIGDLKNEIDRLSSLQPRGPVYLGGQAVEYLPQKRRDEMSVIIEEKEKLRADLDKILQSKNWITELLER
jgi:hypothetical protein